MCGIYGIINFKSEKHLQEMGKTIAHRGPDDQKEYIDGSIGLGYRRLAIIDTEGSFQPLFNEDKSIVLFFNGEIYNYKELREKLKKHKFKTNGDGETIIHWYEEYGPEGFKDLNGMFGLSLYDKKKKKLILARDRFGVKPVYYTKYGDKLAFASEIKALFVDPDAPKIPNDSIIYQYLVHRVHDNTEDTFFNGVKRLMSGHYLVASLNGKIEKIAPYWKPTLDKKNSASTEENVQKFEQLFSAAVKSQLVADVPVGSCLSGGLDSSAIVCQINKAGENKYQSTFSAVFPGQVNNEEKYIDEVVKFTKVTDYKSKPTPDVFWKEVNNLVYHQDEPFISSGPYAQWSVDKLAATKVKVVLDGQGADEMLAGYIAYFGMYFKELWQGKKYKQFTTELFYARDVLIPFAKERIKSTFGMYKPISAVSMLNKDFLSKNKADSSIRPAKDLNERLFNDIFFDSLPALLRYDDRNSMAHSLESRVPFLDNDLMDFVLSLDSSYKIRKGWNKWIMRQGLKNLLPELISKRRWKVGFTTPEIAWMRTLGKEIMAIFESDSFKNRPYFNQQQVVLNFNDYLAGDTDDTLPFWRLLNLELWFRIFIDNNHEKSIAKSKSRQKTSN